MSSLSVNNTTRKNKFDAGEFFRRYGTTLIFLILVACAASLSSSFFSERNIMNVLRQVSGTGIMAVGMLLVIMTRGIDLSVGSIAALGSVMSAIVVSQYSAGASIGIVLLVGAVCGIVSGFLVAYLRLQPFVMTLAMMAVARGIALIVSNGQPIMMGEQGGTITSFGTTAWFGVPLPVVLMLAIFAVAAILLNLTKFGRLVKAIGSNEEAVHLSGIPVARYVLAVYAISGALAALAGVIITSRSGVGSATVGVGAELDVIAAVVIGGASLAGGRGGVFNTLLGVLVFGVIGNIMNLINVPGYHQQVCMGVIIVIAMLLQKGTGWLKR